MSKGNASPADKKPAASSHRRKATVRAAGVLDPLVRKAMRQRGFTKAEVILRWPQIVGPALAEVTMPVELHFGRGQRRDGTLVVRTEGAFATELMHRQTMVIDRINRYYGFRAVARLAIDQGPVRFAQRRGRISPPTLESADRSRLEAAVGGTRDAGLKDALSRLGRRILADSKPGSSKP